jgi:hypothetical protein
MLKLKGKLEIYRVSVTYVGLPLGLLNLYKYSL